jgi:hypothetical protein
MHAPPDHHAGGGQRGRTPARWRAADVTAVAALSPAAGGLARQLTLTTVEISRMRLVYAAAAASATSGSRLS